MGLPLLCTALQPYNNLSTPTRRVAVPRMLRIGMDSDATMPRHAEPKPLANHG